MGSIVDLGGSVTARTEHRQCQSKSRQSGEQCLNRIKEGAVVCHIHGGKSPNVRRKAREREVEVKARKVLADVAGDFDPLGNPLEALENVARRMIRFTDIMGDLVGRLESVRYAGTTGEQLRAEVAVYTKAMVDTARTLESIGRLDIDGRLAAIQGAQADRVVRVVTIVLDIVGAEGELRERARRAAAEELRRVIDPV
jgi:hypothetical protein